MYKEQGRLGSLRAIAVSPARCLRAGPTASTWGSPAHCWRRCGAGSPPGCGWCSRLATRPDRCWRTRRGRCGKWLPCMASTVTSPRRPIGSSFGARTSLTISRRSPPGNVCHGGSGSLMVLTATFLGLRRDEADVVARPGAWSRRAVRRRVGGQPPRQSACRPVLWLGAGGGVDIPPRRHASDGRGRRRRTRGSPRWKPPVAAWASESRLRRSAVSRTTCSRRG